MKAHQKQQEQNELKTVAESLDEMSIDDCKTIIKVIADFLTLKKALLDCQTGKKRLSTEEALETLSLSLNLAELLLAAILLENLGEKT